MSKTNKRRVDTRTRTSRRKSIEALTSFRVSMHCNLNMQNWSGPCGCIELEEQDIHCGEWERMIRNFTEGEAKPTMHHLGQRTPPSVNCIPIGFLWVSKSVTESRWYNEMRAGQDASGLSAKTVTRSHISQALIQKQHVLLSRESLYHLVRM